jgi:hypothetical protein
MHITFAFTNFAGLLFDLTYDGHETSLLNVGPAAPYQMYGPTGGPLDFIELPGSISESPTVFPMSVWHPNAAQSGTLVESSGMYPLFWVSGHAKNTTPLNNSDIDITISVWQILHIVNSGTYGASPSDYFYMTMGGQNYEMIPGMGTWVHNTHTIVFLPASAFVATNAWISNVAGYGIEHVPEPVSLLLLVGGAGALLVGRRRG